MINLEKNMGLCFDVTHPQRCRVPTSHSVHGLLVLRKYNTWRESGTFYYYIYSPPSSISTGSLRKRKSGGGGQGLDNWPQVYYPELCIILRQDTHNRREADWPRSAIPYFRSHATCPHRRGGNAAGLSTKSKYIILFVINDVLIT